MHLFVLLYMSYISEFIAPPHLLLWFKSKTSSQEFNPTGFDLRRVRSEELVTDATSAQLVATSHVAQCRVHFTT